MFSNANVLKVTRKVSSRKSFAEVQADNKGNRKADRKGNHKADRWVTRGSLDI